MAKKLTPEVHAQNIAISNYLVGEDLKKEFKKLLKAQEKDNGNNPASWHADVWANVEDWTVNDVVDAINNTKDELLSFLATHK